MQMDIINLGPAPGSGGGLSGDGRELEHKFARLEDVTDVKDGVEISGYASFFGDADQGGDVVQAGAYAESLKSVAAAGRSIKMLWQHDPAQPIGVWDEVREDARGLWVKGRILSSVAKGREAAALIAAGAIDGLSIGYRTVKASKNTKGQRLLSQLELWEVSLVTFPMQPTARVAAKADWIATGEALREMSAALEEARIGLTQK